MIPRIIKERSIATSKSLDYGTSVNVGIKNHSKFIESATGFINDMNYEFNIQML